jgi:methyl-accepting chemotaxis protein
MTTESISIVKSVRWLGVLSAALIVAVSWVSWALAHQQAGGAAGGAQVWARGLTLAALAVCTLASVWVAGHADRRLTFTADQTELLSRGDGGFTRRMPEMTSRLGRLCRAVNAFIDRLREIAHAVRGNAIEVADVARQISTANAELSARTQSQAHALEESVAHVTQFATSVNANAAAARLAHERAAQAAQAARRGGTLAASTDERMQAVSTSSHSIGRHSIGSIVSAIDTIAFQTTLLALNAAVEAARAGESGRGFAVVASEVRELAQRSAEATREAKRLITEVTAQIGASTRLAAESGVAMKKIAGAIQEVSEALSRIAAATGEQSSAIEQVRGAMVQLEEITHQNAALVEESAASAETMHRQAAALTAPVARFKLDAAR